MQFKDNVIQIPLACVILAFSLTKSCAQDIIFKRDGSLMQAKVLEIRPATIKYKKNNDSIATIARVAVKGIQYANGMKDSFLFKDDINPRILRPIGIYMELGAATLSAGLTANWFITPTINLHAGLSIGGYNLGSKFYFHGNENKKWSPYVGISFFSVDQSIATGYPNDPYINGLFFPIGFHYIAYKGLSFSVELGPAKIISPNNNRENKPFIIGVKLGYQFKKKSIF